MSPREYVDRGNREYKAMAYIYKCACIIVCLFMCVVLFIGE